jgi:D-alanyl-D-alanine carboxypeptidase
MIPSDHLERLSLLHRELGIAETFVSQTSLPFCKEVAIADLVVAQLDYAGRPLVLTGPAAVAWREMHAAACKDGVDLLAFSSFRSYVYQKGLLAAKLKKGVPLAEVLKVLAPPGYSEHHLGEALDISTHDCPQAEEVFATTDAYRWLVNHGASYGFYETYSKNNKHGIVFEPWHWRFIAK